MCLKRLNEIVIILPATVASSICKYPCVERFDRGTISPILRYALKANTIIVCSMMRIYGDGTTCGNAWINLLRIGIVIGKWTSVDGLKFRAPANSLATMKLLQGSEWLLILWK